VIDHEMDPVVRSVSISIFNTTCAKGEHMTILESLKKWEIRSIKTRSTAAARNAYTALFSYADTCSQASPFAHFDLPLDSEVNHPGVEAQLQFAIMAAVKSNKNSKQNAIQQFKSFIIFLNIHCGGNIQITFPPVNVTNSLERQIEIVKYLQNEDRSIAELEDHLWVSDRTIEDDLGRLSEKSLESNSAHDPIEVLGQRLVVRYDRVKGYVSFPSKVHPFFLTSNLTQVITMLEGLRVMSQRFMWRRYAEKQAASIWSQLSDQGKRRIAEVAPMLCLDISWYEKLGIESSDNLFEDEWICSGENEGDSLLVCYKNGQMCKLQYRNTQGQLVDVEECKVIGYDGQNITILQNGKHLPLPISSIMASCSIKS